MNTYTRVRINRVLAPLLLLAAWSPLHAQENYAPAKKHGLKIHTCGNSYTASTFSAGLEDLIKARGYSWGKYKTAGVAGATLTTVIALDGDDLRTQLPTESWDVLVLQSYYSSLEKEKESALKIVEMGRKYNPDIRILMYTIWPTYEERDDPRLGRTEAWNEAIRDAILKEYPKQIVQVIPVSLIYRELYEMIDTGRIPNVNSHTLLFSDGGHPGKYGAYPIMLAAAAMMYNESPIGYPNVSTHKSTLEPNTAKAMQQLVWDVLMTYKGSLMSTGPIIATRRLRPAVEGLAFEQKLDTLNTSGKQKWSLAEGSLPEGLVLSDSGAIEGTPGRTGSFDITIRMTDRDTVSRRQYTLRVDAENPPRITTSQLPTIPHARYVSLKLDADGGVGKLQWELVDGELPPGVSVMPTGFLTGVPGKSGSFQAKLKVSDNHPREAQSDTREVTLTVGEPKPGTIFVRKYDQPVEPVLDGYFDEPYWDFSKARTIKKAVQGKPTATVKWDTFWHGDPKNPKRVYLFVGARIDVGDMGKTPGDALHFFFDGNNTDEVIYNYDDSHFRIQREGDNGGRRLVAGYCPFFSLQLALRQRDYGWDVEARFSKGALSGRGIVAAMPEHYVSGFDIAVEQGRQGQIARKVWQGDANNDTETDAYGTIVFGAETSSPLPVRRLINGDFADDQMVSPAWIQPDNLPTHSWLTTTQRAYYPAWHIQQGRGVFQGDPKGRTIRPPGRSDQAGLPVGSDHRHPAGRNLPSCV